MAAGSASNLAGTAPRGAGGNRPFGSNLGGSRTSQLSCTDWAPGHRRGAAEARRERTSRNRASSSRACRTRSSRR
eukprot:7687632-Lingulodinium_polyedra.AAC.1